MQSRFTKHLLILAATTSLVGGRALAEPQNSQADGVHVYPGAEAIPGAQPVNAGGSPPESTATGAQPQPDTAGANQPSATSEGPPQDSSAVPSSEQDQSGTEQKLVSPEPQPQAGDEEAQKEQYEAQQAVQATQHYAVGTHYFSKWDLDLAELEYDEAVSIYPDLKIAHRDLCLVSLLKLNLPRSLAEFMMVTGITDPTAYNQQDKADLDAKAVKLHYRKALWWGKQYNWHESITELLWAQMYSPDSASIHHSLAFAYASSGDFRKAEEQYKVSFGEDPKNADAHADYATLLMDNGQIARAEAEMRTAVGLSPNAAALHVDLGMIAEAHKDYAEAAKQFQTAVTISPKHAWLWAHLGQLLEHQGETAQAQDAYTKALSLDNDCEEAKTSLDRLKQQKPSA